ncbi:MAG: AAA family ATPase [Deltaproteobacteria bacterium]|nr:AAA family ATPase [Deltaproteobacteria bacterium]
MRPEETLPPPPHNLEAERAVLGGILLNNNKLDVAEGIITPADFYHDKHRIILSAIKTLMERGDRADLITLTDYLIRDKRLDSVGGAAYLSSLLDGRIASAVEDHAKIVQDLARRRRLIEVATQTITDAHGKETTETLLDKAQSELMEISGKGLSGLEDSSFEAVIQAYDTRVKTPRSQIGTGLPTFDRMIRGFNFGQLGGIASRTGVGKTFLAMNQIAHNIKIARGESATFKISEIGFFSMEMGREDVGERSLQNFFNMGRDEVERRYKLGELNMDDFLEFYRGHHVYTRPYSPESLTRAILRDGLKIIYIDHLGLMEGETDISEYQRMSQVIRQMKQIAKRHNVFIMNLLQISRKGGTGATPVTMDMIRDCGKIEEDTDFIIGAWDPSKAEDCDPYWEGKLAVQLLKNKRGEWGKSLVCSFDTRSRRLIEIGGREDIPPDTAETDSDGNGRGPMESVKNRGRQYA